MISEASECAGAQGAFWPYYEVLFQNSRPGEAELKQFAVDLGLDATAFNACLDNHEFAGIVSSQTQFAQQIGVQSAPSFLVNNQPVVGAQPYKSFEQYIEQEIAK